MKLLALDLATATGVAFGDTGGQPLVSTEYLGEPGGAHPARFSQALDLTNRLIKRHQPDAVALEQAIAGGVKGGESRAQLAMGFRACVMGVCHMRGIRVVEYRVQTIRKHFIGSNHKAGTAKAATIARCRQLGWLVANDNEADALAVWDYARWQLARVSSAPTGLFDHVRHAPRQ